MATTSITRYRPQRRALPRLPLAFADWCVENAAGLVLPLELNSDVVGWLISVMRSSGEMRGITTIPALQRNLELRRSTLRFPTELEWERVQLTARVLYDAFKNGVVA